MSSFQKSMREFHPVVYLLLAGTIFVVMARSMSIPFLAIYMSSNLHLDPATIGLVLGAGAIAGMIGGFIGGTLSDYLGRKQVLIGTLFVTSLVFLGFVYGKGTLTFLLLNIVMGLSSSFYDPVSKAMLGDFVPAEKRLRVFSFRYMAVNIGFAIGPLIGSFLGLVQNNASFFITAGVYVLYGIVLLLSLRKLVLPDAKRQQTEERVTLKQALRVIRTDAALLFLLLGGVFSVTVHGQMSVTLSQYLNGNFEDGVKLFAVLMSVNAVTVVACQLFLTKMSEHWKPIKAIAIGSLLLALGEVGFATSNGWVLFLLSMFVFTIGEIFLIPAEYLALDRITPDHMRGMYYGAQTFTNLGNFIGPWFGGFLLAAYGGPVMFLVMGVISIAAIYFFWKAQRVTERRSVPEKIAF